MPVDLEQQLLDLLKKQNEAVESHLAEHGTLLTKVADSAAGTNSKLDQLIEIQSRRDRREELKAQTVAGIVTSLASPRNLGVLFTAVTGLGGTLLAWLGWGKAHAEAP